MTEIMSPSDSSPITYGQCVKLVDILLAALSKSGLPSQETQMVLESQADALTYQFVSDLRHRVELINKSVVFREVQVDRESSPEDLVNSSGRGTLILDEAVAAVPHGTRKTVNVFFFQPNASVYDGFGRLSNEALAHEYDLRGLVPDPRAQFAANMVNPEFSDEHPNACVWKDARDEWCFMSFYLSDKKRYIHVSKHREAWRLGQKWWFAGILRK